MLMKKTIKKMLTKNNDEENVDEKTMTLQKTQKVGSFFPLRLIGLLPRNPGEATINQSMSSKSLVSKSLSNVTPTQTRSAQLLKSIPNPTQTCRH